MLKRYSYRAYPSAEQVEPLARAFGCARWVYNMGIEVKETHYKETGKSFPTEEVSKRLPVLKKTPETAWLSEVSSIVLQQSLADLAKGYKNFFDGIKAKKRVGRPKFKKRTGRQSFRIVGANSFAARKLNKRWGAVYLPKVGDVKFRLSRDLPSTPTSATMILNPDGTYEVSFVVDAPHRTSKPTTREAGIDLGLSHFAAIAYSDGTREKVENPRHTRQSETKLAKAQKDLSRKKKGSSNRNKARLRVAKHHSTTARKRLDFLNKLSTALTDENQVVITEGLSVKGLAHAGARGARGRGMRRSVHDAGWGMFLSLLSQKALEKGREHVKTDMFFPSTRMCCLCGVISEKKDLSVRAWSCECSPDVALDRDYNAAVNELIAGGHSVYGEDVRRTLASV